jgi:hypothetical protein
MSNQTAGNFSTEMAGDRSTGLAGDRSTTPLEAASDYLVGGGILTMALFPLAIPMVALLIVAALPLLVAGVVVGAVGAVLAAPVLLARGVWRRLDLSHRRERRRPPIERGEFAGEPRDFPGNRPVMGARG